MKKTDIETRRAIVRDLEEHPGSLAVDVAKRMGKTLNSICAFLRNAKKHGLVHEKPGKMDNLGRPRNVWFAGEMPADDQEDEDDYYCEKESVLTETIRNVTDEDMEWMRYWSARREKRMRAIKST